MSVDLDDFDLDLEEDAAVVVRSVNLGPPEPFEPIYLGPVYQKDAFGLYIQPEHTLGWDAIAWSMKYLRGADGSRGWKFTNEQTRFILWFYAIDERGRWLYRDAILQLIKGAGKDPIAAVLCAIEFVGPCRFGGWETEDGPLPVVRDQNGSPTYVYEPGATPIAVPVRSGSDSSWVQIMGVAREQTKNTMMYLQGLFTDEAKKRYDIQLNKQIIYGDGNTRRIEVQTSAPRTLEGNRPSFIVGNEPHHWLANNEGHEVKKAVDRNVNKMRGPLMKSSHTLWITNAYDPAEDSVAQKMREGYEAQIAKGESRTLYHSIEAPETVPLLPDYTRLDEDGNRIQDFDQFDVMIPPDRATILAHMKQILEILRGDAFWLDPEETVDEILKPDNPIETSRRFYLNSLVNGADDYLRDADIRATIHPQLQPLRQGFETGDVLRLGWNLVGKDEPIVLFFDGSKSDDSTAIVGCRVSDGYFFLVGLWAKPRGRRGLTWLAPRDQIDARVHEAFARFNVAAFWADPSHTKDDHEGSRYWDTLIDAWHIEFSPQIEKRMWAVQGGEKTSAIMWDMASPAHQEEFSKAVVRFADEMDVHGCVWDGHPELRLHLQHARRSWGRAGLTIRKPARGGTRKIDAAVCAVGAKMLARLAALKAEVEEKKNQEVWW